MDAHADSMKADSMKEYEAPRIVDHGDLTELTASTNSGLYYDASYGQGSLVVPDQTNSV